MSSSFASGTKSLMNGVRFSVRLPRRMVAICVSEPMGAESPRRMLSTPAMKVVATAPRPGVRMPSVPVAGATARDSLELNAGLLSEQVPPGGAPLTGPGRRIRGGPDTARGLGVAAGRLTIDVDDALDDGDPGGH